MEMTIQAGAKLDLASGEELSNGFEGIHAALSHEPKPIYLTKPQVFEPTTANGGAQIVLLDFGSPPSGSIWQIRFVTTFGNDDSTVIASTVASLYCGSINNLSLSQLRIVGIPIPATTYTPDTVMWCHPTETIVVKSSVAIPLGQQFGAVVGLEEWLEPDVSRGNGNWHTGGRLRR